MALAWSAPAYADGRPIEFERAATPTDGMIVLPVSTDGALTGLAADADAAAAGAISKAISLAQFKGKSGQTLTLYGAGPFDAVLLIGTGAGIGTITEMQTFGALAASGTAAWPNGVRVVVPDAETIELDALVAAIGARLGGYNFGKWGALGVAGAEALPPQPLIFLSPDAAGAASAFPNDGEA